MMIVSPSSIQQRVSPDGKVIGFVPFQHSSSIEP
jgi:hypothetical protein